MATPTQRPAAHVEWRQNRWLAEGDLFANLTVAHDGFWQPVELIWPLAIIIGGDFETLAADLLVCNGMRKPDDTDNDWPAPYSFTAKGVFTITQPFRWIKLRVTSIAGGVKGLNANYGASSGSTD